jgi:hypothetical protein
VSTCFDLHPRAAARNLAFDHHAGVPVDDALGKILVLRREHERELFDFVEMFVVTKRPRIYRTLPGLSTGPGFGQWYMHALGFQADKMLALVTVACQIGPLPGFVGRRRFGDGLKKTAEHPIAGDSIRRGGAANSLLRLVGSNTYEKHRDACALTRKMVIAR